MLETYGLFRTRFDYICALPINNTNESQFLIYTDIFFTMSIMHSGNIYNICFLSKDLMWILILCH